MSCDRSWASTLEGSLEDLQSSVKISSLSINTMKQAVPMSTRSLSLSSFGSASNSTTKTPLSPIQATPPGEPGTFNFDTSIGTEWYGTGPRLSLTPSRKMPDPSWGQFQGFEFFKFTPPPSDITWEPDRFSPTSIFLYRNTFDKSEFPTLPTSYTTYSNSYSGFTSPEPLLNSQVLGMSLDVPSEIEQTRFHVPLSSSLTYGVGEETSDWDFRDLDLQYPHTF